MNDREKVLYNKEKGVNKLAMTNFEEKLLADLRAGKSVDELMDKFNEILTGVHDVYCEENRLAAEEARKQEEERKKAESEARSTEIKARLIADLEEDMDDCVRQWAICAINGVTEDNINELIPDYMLNAMRDALTEIVSPMSKAHNVVPGLFDLVNKSKQNSENKSESTLEARDFSKPISFTTTLSPEDAEKVSSWIDELTKSIMDDNNILQDFLKRFH